MRACPSCFLTRQNDRRLRVRALRAGIDDLLSRDDSMDELAARLHNVHVREAIRRDGHVRRDRKGVTGRLENLALPDIVQMLVIGMKTACVSLEQGERKGRIWFESGGLVAAECGKRKGEGAFYDLVCWLEGEFLIEHGVRAKRHNLTGDAMFLLMEALRRLDEAGNQVAAS